MGNPMFARGGVYPLFSRWREVAPQQYSAPPRVFQLLLLLPRRPNSLLKTSMVVIPGSRRRGGMCCFSDVEKQISHFARNDNASEFPNKLLEPHPRRPVPSPGATQFSSCRSSSA